MQNAATVVQRRMFTIRFSEEELSRLEKVAKFYGLTQAGVLRMLLVREERQIEVAHPPAAPKPSRRK